MTDAAQKLKQLQQYFESQIDHALPCASSKLTTAMRYSVLNGGKRLRPLLVYASGIALQAQQSILDEAAIAVELIHCYSLVHDDLPAMDDDDLRRGQPTCHKAFDEATAILVGDALQSLAFERLANIQGCPATTRIDMVAALAEAAGAKGMVAGQCLDLESENKALDFSTLQQLHQQKTGALFSACLKLGTIAAECNNQEIIGTLQTWSEHLGLAFQIKDDLLDIEGTTEQLGKPRGSDTLRHKSTYPALLGVDQARKQLQQLQQEAQELLDSLPFDSTLLALLGQRMVQRDY